MGLPTVSYEVNGFHLRDGVVVATVEHDGARIEIPFPSDAPLELFCTRQGYMRPVPTLVANRDAPPGTLDLFQVAIHNRSPALAFGAYPDIRPIAQWEYDRFCASGKEPVDRYDWNGELYRLVVAYQENHVSAT